MFSHQRSLSLIVSYRKVQHITGREGEIMRLIQKVYDVCVCVCVCKYKYILHVHVYVHVYDDDLPD